MTYGKRRLSGSTARGWPEIEEHARRRGLLLLRLLVLVLVVAA
jgi:hypothetical protein